MISSVFITGLLTADVVLSNLWNHSVIIKPRENKIKLFLLGSGDSFDKICEIIRTYNLQDTVKLHGWVDYDQVPEFISIADLCIVPLPDIDWWRVSSPLKLMEYIACGKNILLTDMVAHTNVIGRNGNYFLIREPTPEYHCGRH